MTKTSMSMIIGAALLLTLLFQPQASANNQSQVKVKKTITQEIIAAKKLIKERDRLGKKFIKIFVDKKQPMALRHDTVLMLGKLKYFPAIDVLILQSSEVQYPEVFSEMPAFAPHSALNAIGFGASPQVIDFVLKGKIYNKEGVKVYLLPDFYYADATTARYLKSYYKGLRPPEPKDWKRKSALQKIRRSIPDVYRSVHANYPSLPYNVKFAKFTPKTDAQKVIVKEIEAANKMADERERLGKLLTKFLKDSRQPTEQRIDAALLLGEMQYFPAISVLVKNIHLKSSKAKKASPAPLPQALAHFGNAAVPAIVDRSLKSYHIVADRGLLKEKNVIFLYQSIKAGKTIEIARTYAKGIAIEKPDDKTKQRVKAFLKGLTEIEKP